MNGYTRPGCHRSISSPGRKETKLTLRREPPFLNSYHGNWNPLSPGHLPKGPHRPAGREGGSATSVPSHCAHSTNKGANSASWPHDMDTCPRGIGPNIGDFHRGQPTAGRQELPGHCHLGLNWNIHTRHKGCVCNTASLPP